MPYQGGKTRPNCRLSNCSLFQALRWWGRREKLAGREKGRERERASAAPALPSFLPFHFRVCTFSIQRTRLSRSLEQATRTPDKNARFFKHQVLVHEKLSEMLEICNQALGPVLVKATLFGSSTIVSGWERGRWRPAPARFAHFF